MIEVNWSTIQRYLKITPRDNINAWTNLLEIFTKYSLKHESLAHSFRKSPDFVLSLLKTSKFPSLEWWNKHEMCVICRLFRVIVHASIFQ